MDAQYRVYARKYRPRTFEEMIGQKAVVRTLRNALSSGRVAQAYLFSGMRGVGKTSAARILAKALNCVQGPTPTPCNVCEHCVAINEDRLVDVLEIDGASNRGIDDIRALRENLRYKPLHAGYKVIIIDEVHQVTGPAFNALLKTLEEPPPHTVFIFATTEYQKVPATILSRCQHFEFKKVSEKDLSDHLLDIAGREGLTITPYGVKLIARASEGSLRDALSLLDQAVAFSGETIGDGDLREVLGTISRDLLYEFSSAVLEEAPGRIFPLVERVMDSGTDLRAFLRELVSHFRDLMIARMVENSGELLPAGDDERARLRAESEKASDEDLLRCLQALQGGEATLRYSSHPQIAFETLLVRICHFRKLIPMADILRDADLIKPRPRPAPGPSSGSTGPKPHGSIRPFSGLDVRTMSAGSKAPAAPLPTPAGTPPVEGPGRPVPARPSAVRPVTPPAAPAQDPNAEAALKHPNVRMFTDRMKGRIISVEPVKAPRTDEEA